MKTFLIRFYIDGSIEFPNGKVMSEKELIERASDKNNRLPIKMFREVYDLMKTICLEDNRKLRVDAEDGKSVYYFEFVNENLDDSRNPALNN